MNESESESESDCMFVINGFARGRRNKHPSRADPWKDFWNAHEAIGPLVLVHKVWRSHVTEGEIAAGLISPLEAHGNEAADKLAASGALRNALSGIGGCHPSYRLPCHARRNQADRSQPVPCSEQAEDCPRRCHGPVRRVKFDPTTMTLLNRT